MQHSKNHNSIVYTIIIIGVIYILIYLDALIFHLLPFNKYVFDFFICLDEMLDIINLLLSCLLLYQLKFITHIFIKAPLFIIFSLFGMIHLMTTLMVILVWSKTL